MSNHDDPNCFCCPESIKIGIKHRLIVRADDHGDEDLCIIFYHRISWAHSSIDVMGTAYFIFQQKLRLLKIDTHESQVR